MTSNTASGGRRTRYWRLAGWGVAGLLLLVPLVAMQFTTEVKWSAGDFAIMAVLLGSVGLGFEWIVRRSGSFAYRAGGAIAVLAAFLTLWVNGAVGMIGSEDNPFNMWFGLVLIIAFLGAAAARFEPIGMMRTMMAAGAVQAILAAIGWLSDERGGVFSMFFAALWLLAAILFRTAAQEGEAAERVEA